MVGLVGAFFDFDRTLIAENSAASWVRREVREGRLGRRQAAQAGLWFAAYHLGFADLHAAFAKGASSIRGQAESDMAGRTRRWFEEEVRATLLPDAVDAVEEHRRRGHHLVLLTSSSPYVAEPAAELLGLDGYLCTRFAVDGDGLFTGELVLPICYHEGKVTHAREYASARGVDLERSYFYTDSFSDLPMLLAVGVPRVVNPDPRLRREARRRGWEVLTWAPGARAGGESERGARAGS